MCLGYCVPSSTFDTQLNTVSVFFCGYIRAIIFKHGAFVKNEVQIAEIGTVILVILVMYPPIILEFVFLNTDTHPPTREKTSEIITLLDVRYFFSVTLY